MDETKPAGGTSPSDLNRWYNNGVAHLPAKISTAPTRAHRVRNLLLKGWTADEIADRLARGDPMRKRIVRAQILRIVATDDVIQAALGQLAKGSLIEGVPAATDALMRRAGKGNVPAIKLAMEASGFHNPRVDHQHSGKVVVEFKGVPRPEPAVDISEADVVEDV